MIVEQVTFKLPESMTREQLLAKYERTVPQWRQNPDLILKSYLYDASESIGGGLYIWKNRAAAEAAHDPEWRLQFSERWGTEPEITIVETLIVVDNLAQATLEDEAEI